MFLSYTPPPHFHPLLSHFSFLLLLPSPPTRHFVHLLLLSYFIYRLRHPEFLFVCTSSSLLTPPNPLISPILLCLLFLHHIRLSAPLPTRPFSSPPRPVAAQLSGHPEPLHLPTTSAALLCPTVPISPEGWASAAHSTQASSGVPGTSRVPPIPAGPHPRHYRMATARPGGHTAPQAFSASSHPSLYAGE